MDIMCDIQMIKTYWVVWRSVKKLVEMINHEWYQQLHEIQPNPLQENIFQLIVIFPLFSDFHQIILISLAFDILRKTCHQTRRW